MKCICHHRHVAGSEMLECTWPRSECMCECGCESIECFGCDECEAEEEIWPEDAR